MNNNLASSLSSSKQTDLVGTVHLGLVYLVKCINETFDLKVVVLKRIAD